MDTSHATVVNELLHALPSDPAQRAAALQRLTDIYAAAEASAALRTAAAPLRGTPGPIAEALCAASDAWRAVTPGDPNVLYGPADDRLRRAISSDAFLALIPGWVADLREIAVARPGTGACTVASGMQLWLWTMNYFRKAAQPPETAVAELAGAFAPVLAARCRIVEIAGGAAGRDADGSLSFVTDLCHAHAARVAAAVGSVCAELVYGYRRHLAWDGEGCSTCYGAEALDELEGLIPGIASSARGCTDVVEADGSHPAKAGPCVRFDGVEPFTRLRARLDGCLTGARMAKDRAAAELPRVLSVAPLAATG
jgi:hypothetical protein